MQPTLKDLSGEAIAHGNHAVKQLMNETTQLATHGMDVVREGAFQVREKSGHLRDATASYIQHEPVKAVLMAAAAGAAIMGLLALFNRSGGARH